MRDPSRAPIGRREAVQRLAAFAAGVGAGGLAACAEGGGGGTVQVPMGPLGPLGLQLYTLRDDMSVDVAGTLAYVAEIGFREVEFAGYFGLPAFRVRNALDDAGLASPSALVSVDDLVEGWPETLEYAAEVGHRWMVVSFLHPEMRTSLEALHASAELFNLAADEAWAYGINLGYQTRDVDFIPVEGRLPIDVLLEETDPALVDAALDVYWAMEAGGDPVGFLDRWAGRVPIVQACDRSSDGRMVDVGTGAVDWEAILGARHRVGIRHVYVDHEEAADPWASAQVGFDYMNGLEV